jgi:hypothetical protein
MPATNTEKALAREDTDTRNEEGGPMASPVLTTTAEQAMDDEDILTENEESGLDEESEHLAAVASTAFATVPSLTEVLKLPTAQGGRIGGTVYNRVVSPGDE